MSNSNSTTLTLNTTRSNLPTTPSSTVAYSYLLQVAFGFIALMAFTGNGLLCAVILRNYRMLRSAYNMLIFSLALTDMLTGILLVVTPNYLIALSSYQAPSGILGVVFCKIIGSQYFVFLLGKVSCLKVMCLALERWYSVVKPLKYQLKFKRRRVCLYLVLVWLVCLILHSSMLFDMTLDRNHLRCVWILVDSPKKLIILTYTVVTFFIPTFVTWVTYLHISIALKTSPANHNKRFSRTRFKLLRMCILVALLLTVCWFPNQLYYALSLYGLVKLESPFHHFTIVLAMFNSCTNPMIYCYSNQEYRRRFLAILCPIFHCCRWRKRGEVNISQEPRPEARSNEFDAEKFDDGVMLAFRYINCGYEMTSNKQQDNSAL